MKMMDLDNRLAELIARFEASSDRKGGRARIRYAPPHEAWGPPLDWHRNPKRRMFDGKYYPIVRSLWPQSWYIVYLERTSDRVAQHGSVIGHTKAGTALWLLRHLRQWEKAA